MKNSQAFIIGGLIVAAITGGLLLFRYEYKTVKAPFGETLMKCDRLTGECEKTEKGF
jgi:hypothetical protein